MVPTPRNTTPAPEDQTRDAARHQAHHHLPITRATATLWAQIPDGEPGIHRGGLIAWSVSVTIVTLTPPYGHSDTEQGDTLWGGDTERQDR